MRYRAAFIVGFAVGYVVGARAGRERYEQIKQASQKVAASPPVRKATQVAGDKATELTKVAGDKATELTKVAKDKAATQVPKLTETAKSSASKMRGQLDRLPGRHAGDSEPATVNGTRPAD